MYNGIVLCKDCNWKRSNFPYSEYVKYHPEMKKNAQRQINQICNFILNGKLPDIYRYYPIEIAEALEQYSEGTLQLDVNKYIQKAMKKARARVDANKIQILEIYNTSNEEKKKIKALQNEIEARKQEIQANQENINELAQQNHHEYALINYLDRKINGK